ncbi:MAG: CinA family protein [Chloroflexota bacterium]
MTAPTLEATLGQRLRADGLTIATAESCTGGLIASRLTDISGSSAYVLGGVVAYSNEAKMSLLNVRQGTLIAYGAVSESTATEMASGARALFNTDFALSVTGIAGPGGGTADKPVGLTYIGLASADGVQVRRFIWEGDRIANKRQSADAALGMLLDLLNQQAGAP